MVLKCKSSKFLCLEDFSFIKIVAQSQMVLKLAQEPDETIKFSLEVV